MPRKILDGVLREDPDNVDALFATFENIREDEGASDAAITYLAKALAIDPHDGGAGEQLLERLEAMRKDAATTPGHEDGDAETTAD